MLSVLPALMLILSGVMKIRQSPEVLKGFGELGYPVDILVGSARSKLRVCWCTDSANERVGGDFAHRLFGRSRIGARASWRPVGPVSGPAVFGVIVWLGLVLRDERLRSLLPFRRG